MIFEHLQIQQIQQIQDIQVFTRPILKALPASDVKINQWHMHKVLVYFTDVEIFQTNEGSNELIKVLSLFE